MKFTTQVESSSCCVEMKEVPASAAWFGSVMTKSASSATQALTRQRRRSASSRENAVNKKEKSRDLMMFINVDSFFPLCFQRKKSAVSYLNSPLHQGTRKRGPYEPLILKEQESLVDQQEAVIS